MSRPSDRFNDAYARLAKAGYADHPFGREYWRVRREWAASGRPLPADQFIALVACMPDREYLPLSFGS